MVHSGVGHSSAKGETVWSVPSERFMRNLLARGEGLVMLLRVEWRDGEGCTTKVTFELAVEVEQHFFRERRAGLQQQHGHHLLSPCYVPAPC